MLKVGTKIGPAMPENFYKTMEPLVDFFEIYGDPNFSYGFMKNSSNPIVVHAPHFGKGVNLSNPKKDNFNKEKLKWARKIADKLNAEKIVIHIGPKENKDCSLDYAIKFLNKNFDSRFHIENLVDYPVGPVFMYNFATEPKEIERIIKETGVKFCLDLAHAREYATVKNYNIRDFIKKFLDLNPGHFHLSDAVSSKLPSDDMKYIHLNFFKGDCDLDLIKSLLPGEAWVTLETPQIPKEQIKEINFLRK